MEVVSAMQWAFYAAAAFAAASKVWGFSLMPGTEPPQPLWMQEEEVIRKPWTPILNPYILNHIHV